MRPQQVAEHRGTFLLGAIVGVPVIVHRPRVDGLRRFQMIQPGGRIGQGTDQIGRDPAHFDQRRVGRQPGDAPLVVRDIHPPLHGEPVLARTRDLVGFRTHDAPRHIHPHDAVGHVETEAEVDAFLGADRQLVDGVDDLDVVPQSVNADLAGQLAAARRFGFDQQRSDQGPAFLDGDLHGAAPLQSFQVAAGQVEVIVQRRGRGGVHVLVAVIRQAGDGAGLLVHAHGQGATDCRSGTRQRVAFGLRALELWRFRRAFGDVEPPADSRPPSTAEIRVRPWSAVAQGRAESAVRDDLTTSPAVDNSLGTTTSA